MPLRVQMQDRQKCHTSRRNSARSQRCSRVRCSVTRCIRKVRARTGHTVEAATETIDAEDKAGLLGTFNGTAFRSEICVFVSWPSLFYVEFYGGHTPAFRFPKTESGVAVRIGVFARSFLTSAWHEACQ